MAKFKSKNNKSSGKISTSSLPDIIFILLFFFMVVTVMREVTLKVENRLPQATELTRLEDRSLVKYIYVGKPIPQYQAELGTAPRIQLSDAFADVNEIGRFVEMMRSEMPEDKQSYMTISMKVDKETKIGIVTDIKQELRKADALLLNYTTFERGEVY